MQSRLNVLSARDELRREKSRAQLAFAAYEAAVRSGDAAAAEAARTRFLEASNALKSARRE